MTYLQRSNFGQLPGEQIKFASEINLITLIFFPSGCLDAYNILHTSKQNINFSFVTSEKKNKNIYKIIQRREREEAIQNRKEHEKETYNREKNRKQRLYFC